MDTKYIEVHPINPPIGWPQVINTGEYLLTSSNSLKKVKKSLGTGGSLINLKVKSGRTNLQLDKINCISELYFSIVFLSCPPKVVFPTQRGTSWASLATRWEAAWSWVVATSVLCPRNQKKTFKWTGVVDIWTIEQWSFQQGPRSWWLWGWGSGDGEFVQGDEPAIYRNKNPRPIPQHTSLLT